MALASHSCAMTLTVLIVLVHRCYIERGQLSIIFSVFLYSIILSLFFFFSSLYIFSPLIFFSFFFFPCLHDMSANALLHVFVEPACLRDFLSSHLCRAFQLSGPSFFLRRRKMFRILSMKSN